MFRPSLAQQIHRCILRVYPREIWQSAEHEIFDVFRARLDEARGRGTAAVAGLWFREVTDSVSTGVSARWTQPARVPGFDPRSPREKATSMFDSALNDIRSALRVFRSAPAFALAAVSILAIAIGANTAMFSVINAVMLRPLPFAEPGRLVALYETNPEQGWTQAQVAAANYLDWRERSTAFSDIAAHNGWLNEQTWVEDGEPRVLRVNATTGNFFNVLGIRFALGRGFDSDDDWVGTEPKIVLSHGAWTSDFGADPDVIGKQIDLDGTTRTIVGVAAAEVDYPAPEVDGWVPVSWDPANRTAVFFRRAHGMRAIGRLAPGISATVARDEVVSIASQLEAEYPETNVEMGVGFVSLREWIAGDVRNPLLMLFGAVALVLVIACANVANLQFARATDRRAELALRGALGAARSRLLRQSLVESLALAAVGGALGLGLAAVALRGLVRLLPDDFPRIAEIGLDWRVLAFTFFAVVGTSLVFGIVPSLRASRHEPAADLQAHRVAGSRSRGRVAAGLVAVEVALVLPVAVGAALMIRTLDEMRAVDPGFTADNTTVLGIQLPRTRYSDGDSRNAVFTALLGSLRDRSDFENVALSRRLPFVNQSWSSDFRAESWTPDRYGVGVRHDEISRDLFKTMQIEMLDGRDFELAEINTEPVAIVNRALVEQFFPDGDALGERLCFSRNAEDCRFWYRVVGVAENVRRESLKVDEEPSIYGSWIQNGTSSGYLMIRSQLPPEDVADIAAAALHEIDPTVPFHTVTTMNEIVAGSAAQEQLLLALLATFAAIAVALAAFGVYSVVAYATARRSREIGIRVSLGARAADVFRSVATRGMTPALVGVVTGLALTAALAGFIASSVYGVSVRDPLSYVVVASGLTALALMACVIPARRALRVDPVVVLRAD